MALVCAGRSALLLETHGVEVVAVEDASASRGAGGGGGEEAEWDALVLVTSREVQPPPELRHHLRAALCLDRALETETGVVRCPVAAGSRLVVAPVGALTAYSDVRAAGEAARRGVLRALAAGARRPLLLLQPHPRWPRADLVVLLAALEALHIPLQTRESFPARAHTAQALGVAGVGLTVPLGALLRDALALEAGRALARDVGGADPERMTPARAADHVRRALEMPAPADWTGARVPVRVRIERDPEVIAREYPLFAAVTRAADTVERHRGCIVYLEYEPERYERTVMLVGKGVTYDTGGCDIKAGGVMAGMSRDKCGAATVAGFFKTLSLLGSDGSDGGGGGGGGVKAVGALALVRNSVGADAYVADELLRARCGLSVRVGNTDAEGRMVMADLLAEMCERASAGGERAPHVYSVATLTGHAHRAVGEGYSIAMDNCAARDLRHAARLQAAGELLADMIEVSTIRREDLAAHAGRADTDELHQAGNQPSTQIPRGHQGPAAFLALASGLALTGVPYTHLDVAASAGTFPHRVTAAPLLALAAHYGLIPCCRACTCTYSY